MDSATWGTTTAGTGVWSVATAHAGPSGTTATTALYLGMKSRRRGVVQGTTTRTFATWSRNTASATGTSVWRTATMITTAVGWRATRAARMASTSPTMTARGA